MSKHAPGRLTVRGGYSIYADDGKTPVADTCLTNSIPENDEANARRLVACWNLLQPFTIEQIEAFQADVLALAAQRDELLEALKELLWSHEVGVHMSGRGLDKARAAIAKATGEAA